LGEREKLVTVKLSLHRLIGVMVDALWWKSGTAPSSDFGQGTTWLHYRFNLLWI